MLSDKVHNHSRNLSRGGHTNLHSSEAQPDISKGPKASGKSSMFRVFTSKDHSFSLSVVYLETHSYVAVNGDEIDEKAKTPVVQQKGRFKVTSESVEMEKVNIQISF